MDRFSGTYDQNDCRTRLDHALIGLGAATALLSFTIETGRDAAIENAPTRLRFFKSKVVPAKADCSDHIAEWRAQSGAVAA